MIVKSQNPIYIDSPTGMINTSRSNVRNRVNSRSNLKSNFDSMYSNFDFYGKPENSAETKLFQDWLDRNKPGWHSLWGTLNKDVIKGYGAYPFGPMTEQAWGKYGQEFVNFGRGIAQQTLNLTLPITNPNLAVTDPQGNKRQGQFWDKIKGLWVKAQESGLLTSAGNLIRGNQPTGNWQGMDPNMQGQGGMQPQGQPEPEKKGMSGGTIALIIGGVAVVGVLLYLMTKTDAPAQAPAPAK